MAITFFGSVGSGAVDTEPGPITVTPPASMASGDLAVLIGSTADVTGTMSVSTTGGQTWNALTQYSTTNNRTRIFWAQFNGTWSASPQMSTSGGIQDFGTMMLVFRPTSGSNTWSLDVAPTGATYAAPGSAPGNVTNTGITTIAASTVAISLWSVTASLPTWVIQTAGWVDPTVNVMTSSFNRWIDTGVAYHIYSAAGATGNVTTQCQTNTAGIGSVVSFAETGSAPTVTVDMWYQRPAEVTRPVRGVVPSGTVGIKA